MVKRRTFFSFRYKPDNWRASQVRNMGVVEGNELRGCLRSHFR